MKKIISLIMIMALTISSFVFASAEDTAPSDLYGTVYYETDFSETLNTTDKTKPYWQLAADAAIADGVLTVKGTSAFVFPAVAMAPEGENIVLEANVKFNAVTNADLGGVYMKKPEDAKDLRNLKTHIYGQKLILNDNGSAAVTGTIDTTAWYKIKFIYKAATGDWDVLANENASLKNHKHANSGYHTIGGGIHRWIVQNNISIDSMKIYSTKNVVQLDFDTEATNADFCKWNVTKTSADIGLTTEDGRDCLMLKQTVENEASQVDIHIPGVYGSSTNPYLVVESSFKNTGGDGTEILRISGNSNGQHMATTLRQYGNFLYMRDPASGASAAYKVAENVEFDKWHFVQLVFDTTNPASVTYDVYFDNKLSLENVPCVIASVDEINMITFRKANEADNTLFVDEINVYNATEAIVSSFDVTGTTSYAEGEIGSLSAQVKAIDGTTLEKQVTYFIKDEYENVFVATNGDVSADIGVQPGIFTVVATMEANGITYTKEVPMRVTDAASGYKLLSSSVDTSAAEFKLADLSASGATLWSAVAVYESDGSLKDIVINKPDFDGYVWNANVPLDGIAQEGDAVKVFFWESISGMKPYFASLEN